MSEPAPQTPSTRRKPTPEFTWEDVATALLPVLACFLGGATEKWAEGIIVAVLGVLLVVNPPRYSLGAGFHAVLVALLALAALAFLPAHWFFLPDWREALTNDFGLTLPSTLSAQPWMTGGALLSFVAGICWLYYVTGQDVEIRAARRQLRIFAVGVIALAALMLLLSWRDAALPFWHNQRGFGPFPNRNQTANLLGLTSIVIVACGYDDIRRKKGGWIFWLLGLAVVAAALVLNFSRAGLVLLLLGNGIWLAVLVIRSRSTARIALAVSALLVLVTLLLLFGGQTLERFNLRGHGTALSSDFRWLIFRDAFQLIRASPWAGLGLGNFESVFAMFRHASFGQESVLHPESDWIWLCAEMGWPAVVLVLAGVILLARRVFPFVEGTNQWFRLAAFIAAILFALHSVVDVAGHRVGSAYAGIFLFALSLRRPFRTPIGWGLLCFFRGLGFVLAVVGTTWMAATYRGRPLPGAVGADVERHLATVANVGQQFPEAIAHADAGLHWAPLAWQLYFVRALGEVGAKRPTEALDDFRRARFLEPNSFEVPYQEGLTWLARDPVLAVSAWEEALRRSGPQAAELFSRMLSSASRFSPPAQRMLEQYASSRPELALTYLERARQTDFSRAVKHLLERDPQLTSLTPEQRARLFALWSDHGDLDQLAKFIAAHPEMMQAGWSGIAKQKAATKDFRGAYEMARQYGTRPALPQLADETTPTDQLERASVDAPDDYRAAFVLYQRQMQASQIDDALVTVRRMTDQHSAPPYFHFLEAEAWAAKENWERAWQARAAFDATAK
ncbi:MAG: O-antigen ligase family protein [Chthoniobacterales bacterium]